MKTNVVHLFTRKELINMADIVAVKIESTEEYYLHKVRDQRYLAGQIIDGASFKELHQKWTRIITLSDRYIDLNLSFEYVVCKDSAGVNKVETATPALTHTKKNRSYITEDDKIMGDFREHIPYSYMCSLSECFPPENGEYQLVHETDTDNLKIIIRGWYE